MAGKSDPFDDENDEELSDAFHGAAAGYTLDDLAWAQKEKRAFILPTHAEAEKFRNAPHTPICIMRNDQGEIIAGYARAAYETTIDSMTDAEWTLIGVDLITERPRIEQLKRDLDLGPDTPLTYVVFDVQRHVVLSQAPTGLRQKLANPDFVLRLNS